MSSPLQLETRKTLPLDFTLLNDQDLNALYITDDPVGQSLRLELQNHAGEQLDLLSPPQSGHPAYHFELVFRPGVLSEALLPKLSVKEANVAMTKQKNDDGTISIQLKVPAGTMAAGAKTVITLVNINPDGKLGSRGTRVMLRYYNVQVHGADTVISGFREAHLNIVTHLGKQNIPLNIGIVGAGQVLNNGAANPALLLRVSNISTEYAIQPSDSPDRPSFFFISFEVGNASEEWALGTTEQVKGVLVQYKSGDKWVDAVKEGGDLGLSPEWKVPVPALAKKSFVDLRLANVVTTHPAGLTKVHIRYENIPGYWDGHFVSFIEKSPIVMRGGQVGIGMVPSVGTLHVFNPTQFPIAIESSSDIGTWFRLRNTSAGGRAWNIISTGAKNGEGAGNLLFKQDDGGPIRLMLDGQGKVGIGTIKPTDNVQIGDFNVNADQYLSIKTAGGNRFKAGLRFCHYTDYVGYTIVSDETIAGLQILGRHGDANFPAIPIFNIRAWGSAPAITYTVDVKATKFQVSGGANAADLVLEADTDNSGGESPTLTMRTNGGNTVGQFGFMDKNRNLLMRNHVSNTTFAVQHDGNIVAYRGSSPIWATNTAVSDITLKTGVQPIANPLQRLTALNGISFRWKDDCFGKNRELGLVAQEVEQVFPELMHTLDQDAKLVQYEKFVPVLVEAIKEQQKMIEELREMVNLHLKSNKTAE